MPTYAPASQNAWGNWAESSPEVVAALDTALRDEDATVCFNAAASLGHLGQMRPEVVAALLTALGQGWTYMAIQAAVEPGTLGADEILRWLRPLITALGDEDANVRVNAA